MNQADEPDNGTGVLASLPTTRPQRRSPKRSPAARTPPGAAPPPPAAPRPRSSALGAGGPDEGPPIAAQGFEPPGASASVEPPSRTDLLGSAVGGAGDLAHAGLDLGRYLLRAALRRLPG